MPNLTKSELIEIDRILLAEISPNPIDRSLDQTKLLCQDALSGWSVQVLLPAEQSVAYQLGTPCIWVPPGPVCLKDCPGPRTSWEGEHIFTFHKLIQYSILFNNFANLNNPNFHVKFSWEWACILLLKSTLGRDPWGKVTSE